MVKVVYTSEENNLRETLKKIKYNSQPTKNTIKKYFEENKELINSINSAGKYSKQSVVLLSFFKKEFESGDYAKIYKLPAEFKIDDDDLFKSIRLTCHRLTRIVKGNRKFSLDDEPWLGNKFSIFVIYVLQENARLGNKKKIRPNRGNMNEIAGIYVDKENKILKTMNLPEKLGMLFETLLQNELNIQLFQPKIPENGSWKEISSSVMKKSENIEIEEIGFNLTDQATGEKIIIKSHKGNVKEYLDAMLNQKTPSFIDPEKFDLSYVEYMKVRYKQGHTNFLKFSRDDSGALFIENRSKYKNRQLEKELANIGMPIGKSIIDVNKVSDSKLLQQIIIRGFLSEKERNLDVYKKIMEKLSSHKLIKRIKDVLLYKCFGSIKCWNSSAFRTKNCPHCNKSNKTRWWCQGKDIELNIGEIEKELKKKANKLGAKYRKLKTPFYNKKYELRKLSIPNFTEVNIYFNRKGLYKEVLKDFSLCPRALYCVNFRGEIKKFPEFICQEDASEFVFRLFDNDENKLMDFLKQNVVNQSLAEVKENSFNESLEELRKVKKNKELNEKNKGGRLSMMKLMKKLVSCFFLGFLLTMTACGVDNQQDGINLQSNYSLLESAVDDGVKPDPIVCTHVCCDCSDMYVEQPVITGNADLSFHQPIEKPVMDIGLWNGRNNENPVIFHEPSVGDNNFENPHPFDAQGNDFIDSEGKLGYRIQALYHLISKFENDWYRFGNAISNLVDTSLQNLREAENNLAIHDLDNAEYFLNVAEETGNTAVGQLLEALTSEKRFTEVRERIGEVKGRIDQLRIEFENDSFGIASLDEASNLLTQAKGFLNDQDFSQVEYSASVSLIEAALDIITTAEGIHAFDFSNPLSQQPVLSDAILNFNEAYQKAFAIYSETGLGADSLEDAIKLYGFARDHIKAGEYDQAISAVNNALGILRQIIRDHQN